MLSDRDISALVRVGKQVKIVKYRVIVNVSNKYYPKVKKPLLLLANNTLSPFDDIYTIVRYD